eukprot:2923211-Pyramimonas_sp.AAC.1
MEAQLWLKAPDHYYGKGMQHGMDTTMLMRTLQKLRKADRVQEAGSLEALACGAIWTGQRCKDAGYRIDAKCPRCSKAADTLMHRLYECEMNDNLSIEAVVKSQSLCRRAPEEMYNDPDAEAFWLRGLLPRHRNPVPPPLVWGSWGGSYWTTATEGPT